MQNSQLSGDNKMTKENSDAEIAKRRQERKLAFELALSYGEANRNPSEVDEIAWIYAKRKIGEYPAATENNGKWLIFVPLDEVDKVWAKIKQATEEGKLGKASKVATAFESGYDSNQKVICVYTYDWTDTEDVRRIRAELRELGITRKIPYKSDKQTLSGEYQATGHKRISKYYE